jgi:hypothetical protein
MLEDGAREVRSPFSFFLIHCGEVFKKINSELTYKIVCISGVPYGLSVLEIHCVIFKARQAYLSAKTFFMSSW